MSRPLGPYRPFQDRLDVFARDAKDVWTGRVEALHRTRVASRRLREVLPVLGLDAATARKLSRRLKKVTQQLGTVRELDVLGMVIDELGRDPRYASAALTRLGTVVEDECVAARGRLAAKLPLAKMQRLARRLERAVAERQSDDERIRSRRAHRAASAWMWALDARSTHRAARVHAAVEAAGAVYGSERLHRVRIAVKKLRYTMELRAEARPSRPTRDVTDLKRAQDLLGRLHDLEVLIGRARQMQAAVSPPSLEAWRELGSLVRALEDDCRALHGRFMRHRAKVVAIANRIAVLDTATAAERRAVG